MSKAPFVNWIPYPIAQDNEFRTWDAWGNRAWPSFYLLDGDGRFAWFAKARDMPRRSRAPFAACLVLRAPVRQHPADDADLSQIGTPEIYFR